MLIDSKMIDYIPEHHVEKHIVKTLMQREVARFRDMRPPRCETNLYSYYLKKLQLHDYVKKTNNGYRLGQQGMFYVDRVSTQSYTVRKQPKIITMIVVWNSAGEVLMHLRRKQPYFNTWTLPYGKLHIEDGTVISAAQRELCEKTGLNDQSLSHCGEVYIRVTDSNAVVMSTLAHVFVTKTEQLPTGSDLRWTHPSQLTTLPLAPAVEEIIALSYAKSTPFFEEITVEW